LGQKVNPIGFRLGINKTWSSNWFDEAHFADKLMEDVEIRRYILNRKAYKQAGIAKVEISRHSRNIVLTLHTARPGLVIGRKGQDVERLRQELNTKFNAQVQVNILEIKKPELVAQLVADSVARQLEGRVSFRRAMKKTLQATMRNGAEGIKIMCSGRLGGAEMSRREMYKEGRIPLHTLRADIDYALSEAHTTYGLIGVKVWICKGEKFGIDYGVPRGNRSGPVRPGAAPAPAAAPRGPRTTRKG
jgi:small subunit ribosomal protein S3